MSAPSELSLRPSSRPVLVSDFDGTMTRHDFFQLVRARWWDETQPDPWQDYLAGRITHFEALNRFFGQIRTDEAGLRDFLNQMELDPDLPSALSRLSAAGWDIVIASAGCGWYISHLLAHLTIPITLHANPGRFDPDHGLRMLPPTASPFYSGQTGIDKPTVVRDALLRHPRVAFAGDGPPDLPAAKLIAPDLRFARGWLAQALREQGEAFHPLTHWSPLVDRLLQTP